MKTVLAVQEVEEEVSALEPALRAAKRAGAHLNIVLLGVLRVVPMTAAPGVPVFYFDEANKELHEAAKVVEKQIQDLVIGEDVSASITMELRDVALVEQTILRHALFCDATLFANRSIIGSDLKTRAFNGALLGSGTPGVVLADGRNGLPDFNTVMFAWDSEPQASKALHQSLSWINEGAKAHVVVIDPNEAVHGQNPGDNIAAYLARHKLDVVVDRLPSGGRVTSEVLMEHANDIDADLIVMGAYSHSRLRQWLLGGTTRNMLEKSTRAMFMAH